MAHDLYHLLGVRESASEREIRYAFHRKAKLYHPDRFGTAPPIEQQRAEARMTDLNEAYSVLSSPPRRNLYDECRRSGRDFRVVEMEGIPESPAERAAREQAEATQTAARLQTKQLAVQVFHNHLISLDDTVRWQETQDEYFDKLLSGRQDRVRITIHLKILDVLTPEHLPGIEEYARALLGSTTASLIRTEFHFLLVGRTVEQPSNLEFQVARANAECWQISSPLAPRAYLAWMDAREGEIHAPGVARVWPDLRERRLRLGAILG